MNSIRKWIFRPKRSDTAFLAQFYYADEELNLVASELDSFDGRKDPERCTNLVNQLRRCQDAVLGIVEKIMGEMIPCNRASRDYRVKFPDDVLQESLAGQLWFGAECLAAGSSILNHEVESASMRPLAKTLTRHLDQLRSLLREQSLKNQTTYTDKIIEMLIEFDKLFAEFELSYVSAMVPVKTMREHDLLQEVMVLFCETVQRALKLRLLSQEQLDAYDPALMFTIPRLAIVCGLLVYPEGPLNPDMDPLNMSEMFRPFQTLLFKIRELLWTLSREELWLLEKSLCSTDDAPRTDLTNLQTERGYGRPQPAGCESTDSPSTPVGSDMDDEDNIDPADMTRGVMVHSDSTMTVVERVNVLSDLAVVDANGLVSDDDDDDPEEELTNSSALDDAAARRLQHSKSWPKTTHRNSYSTFKPNPQTTEVASSVDSGAANSVPSRVTEEGQRSHRFHRSGHEFNFNLPYNTGSQEAIAAPVSLEVSFAHVHETNRVKARTKRPGFIYIAQSEDEEEEDNPKTAQQISFITDAFCQLFNPNTPIGSAVVRLKSGANWAHASVVRDGATKPECSNQSGNGAKSGDGTTELESSYNGSEELMRHPPGCRRWFSMPAGDTSIEVSRTDALANDAVVCDITDGSSAAADLLLLGGVAGLTPTACHNSISGLSLDAVSSIALPVTQSDVVYGDELGLSHLLLPAAACDDSNAINAEVLSAKDGSIGADSDTEFVDSSEIQAATEIDSSETAAEDLALVTLGSVACESMANWAGTQSSMTLEPLMQSSVPLDSVTDGAVTQSRLSQTRTPSTLDNCQSLDSPELGMSLSSRKVIGNSGKRKVYSRTGRDDVCGESNRSNTIGKAAGKSAANWTKAETGAQPTSAVEQSSCYTCLDYDWDRERSLQNCSYCSSETSSYTSENHDDEEIAMAIQAAEVAARNEARSRFKSSTDLIHRLFVCISGVADQLQTNYASDLRHILKAVFECNTSDTADKQTTAAATLQELSVDDGANDEDEEMDYSYESSTQAPMMNSRVSQESVGQPDSSNSSEPPEWIPDEQSPHCMACRVAFTFVRRRHHCRNCGKLFCSHCSSNNVPLPQFGHAKPVRVCNRCYMFRVTPFTTAH